MDKPTKKRTNYNEEILNVLKQKYSYSLTYIRMCLRGDRAGEMPDIIKKEYNSLDNAAKNAIQTQLKILNTK
ncbi:hypothetical protein GCM10022217_16150 [Chryseobacterium ginsenosidimutans]|uniref:hypothetical protein n=1 Tax=Chryseobacterium ginsenosidimutans TaxID=687846 RepID=UPI0031E0B261